jgi:hypothetical protein
MLWKIVYIYWAKSWSKLSLVHKSNSILLGWTSSSDSNSCYWDFTIMQICGVCHSIYIYDSTHKKRVNSKCLTLWT